MSFEKIPGIWLILSSAMYVLGLAVCIAATSWGFAAGFAGGGALVLINAWASGRKLKKADFPNKGSVMASLIGGFYVRLVLLGICLFGLIKILKVDPIGLATGLTVVPAGLLVMLALIYIANRRPGEV
jgi:hypothetical protein